MFSEEWTKTNKQWKYIMGEYVGGKLQTAKTEIQLEKKLHSVIPSKISLVDEGGYGCVFYPGISCNGKKEMPNFITKIQKNRDTFKNEKMISERIRKIKGYMKRFAPIVKICPVKLTKPKINKVKKCNILESISTAELQTPLYVSNKIRYVGKHNLREYLRYTPLLNSVLETHVYLLKSLELLNKHDIVHFDIKYNNIMYDEKLKVPIIIDFGLSIYLPDLSPSTYHKAFYVMDTYSYWCIDILICNYIFQIITYENSREMKVTKNELEVIYDTFIYGQDKSGEPSNYLFTLHHIVSESIYDNFKQKYMDYFHDYINKPWFELYEHLIKCSDTWDNYSLSLVYLIQMDEWKQSTPKVYEKLSQSENMEDYLNVLETIAFSMPSERPTLTDTIVRVKSMV